MSDIKTFFTDLSTGTQYDITELGIVEDDSLTTAVIISLFTDKRDTTTNSDDIRGWWADDIGSLRWTLSRSKQTDEVLQRLIKYDKEALQWLIDDRLVSGVEITAQWITRGVLAEQINITLNNGKALAFSIEESS
jgi:phage gp46-like protein